MHTPRNVPLSDLLRSFNQGELREHGGTTSLAGIHAPFRADVTAMVADGLPKGGLVLSVGCGEGWIEEALCRDGVRTVSIDLRPATIPPSRRSVLPFVQADAHTMPFADATFDRLLLNESIGQIDPEIGLRECWRVLKPGGTLVLTTYILPRSDDDQGPMQPFPYAGSIPYTASQAECNYAEKYFSLSLYHVYPTDWIGLALQDAEISVTSLLERYYDTGDYGNVGMILAIGQKNGPARE